VTSPGIHGKAIFARPDRNSIRAKAGREAARRGAITDTRLTHQGWTGDWCAQHNFTSRLSMRTGLTTPLHRTFVLHRYLEAAHDSKNHVCVEFAPHVSNSTLDVVFKELPLEKSGRSLRILQRTASVFRDESKCRAGTGVSKANMPSPRADATGGPVCRLFHAINSSNACRVVSKGFCPTGGLGHSPSEAPHEFSAHQLR